MKHVINCETSVDLQKVTNVYSLNYRIEDYDVSDSLEGKITLFGKYVKDNLEEILDYEEEVEFTVDFDRKKYNITAVECDNLEYDVIFGRGLTVTYDVIIEYEDRDEEIELIKDLVDEETDEILEEVLKNRDDSFLEGDYEEAEYAEINRDEYEENYEQVEEVDENEDNGVVEEVLRDETNIDEQSEVDDVEEIEPKEDSMTELKDDIKETKTIDNANVETIDDEETQNKMSVNRVNISEKDESFIGNLKETYTTYKVVFNVSERNVEELAKKYNKTVEEIYRENNYSINNNLLIKDESKK